MKGKGKERADDALGVDAILVCLRQWSQAKSNDEPLVVAVVGVTNVGLSCFQQYDGITDTLHIGGKELVHQFSLA